MRKIIQFQIVGDEPEIDSEEDSRQMIYALCEDGTMWMRFLEGHVYDTLWKDISTPYEDSESGNEIIEIMDAGL